MTQFEVLLPSNVQKDERLQWCENNIISYLNGHPRFEIENNQLVIYGDIVICSDIEELPIKIDKVYGSVYLENSINKCPGSFKSLKNMPDYVEGCFNISLNPELKTLEGGPSYVGGSYWCNGCGLDNLNGVASTIHGGLLAFCNNIEDAPELANVSIDGHICFDNNPIEYMSDYGQTSAYYEQ